MLVGLGRPDDAGVFAFDERRALVQTVDFFTPIVDDPFTFGQIAVANSLSDVYAMGGEPLTALNIVCYPMAEFGPEPLAAILAGAHDTAKEAGVLIVGGHSVEDSQLKFGMAVTGVVDRDKIWRNHGARVGDRLILTKPLGTGVLATALKRDQLDGAGQRALEDSMRRLNRRAAEVLRNFPAAVHACTDVTGFGLVGHLAEMIDGDPLGLRLSAGALPLLSGAYQAAAGGALAGGLHRNRAHCEQRFSRAAEVDRVLEDLVFDPQTSGGLVVAVDQAQASEVLEALCGAGEPAVVIGEVVDGEAGCILLAP